MKVYRPSKNTWKILAITLILAVAIGGLFIYQNMRQAPTIEQTDAQRFSKEYTSVPEDNRFTYTTHEQVIHLFREGTGVIFLGFPECPWCQHLAPMVNIAAQAEGIETIYYLNIREERANNTADYRQLVSYLAEYLPKGDDGEPRISVPDVTFLKNGKIIHRFKQESAKAGDASTPDTYWTNERQERATVQLRKHMKAIKGE